MDAYEGSLSTDLVRLHTEEKRLQRMVGLTEANIDNASELRRMGMGQEPPPRANAYAHASAAPAVAVGRGRSGIDNGGGGSGGGSGGSGGYGGYVSHDRKPLPAGPAGDQKAREFAKYLKAATLLVQVCRYVGIHITDRRVRGRSSTYNTPGEPAGRSVDCLSSWTIPFTQSAAQIDKYAQTLPPRVSTSID